jgi:hypothetical protein
MGVFAARYLICDAKLTGVVGENLFVLLFRGVARAKRGGFDTKTGCAKKG